MATSDEIIRLQRDHAAARVTELRAQSAVDHARESAGRALAALETAGGESIDKRLPRDPAEAAVELERRSYELTNPPRTVMG